MVPSITCDFDKCKIRLLMSTSMGQVNAFIDIILAILNNDSYTDQGAQLGTELPFKGLVSSQLLRCFSNDVLTHRGFTVFSEACVMSICTGSLHTE